MPADPVAVGLRLLARREGLYVFTCVDEHGWVVKGPGLRTNDLVLVTRKDGGIQPVVIGPILSTTSRGTSLAIFCNLPEGDSDYVDLLARAKEAGMLAIQLQEEEELQRAIRQDALEERREAARLRRAETQARLEAAKTPAQRAAEQEQVQITAALKAAQQALRAAEEQDFQEYLLRYDIWRQDDPSRPKRPTKAQWRALRALEIAKRAAAQEVAEAVVEAGAAAEDILATVVTYALPDGTRVSLGQRKPDTSKLVN